MKYSKDDIIKALECCSLNGCNSCETCPLKEECEENPLESVLAKYTLEVVNDLTLKNKKLTEERDTFRDYAYKMQRYVENVNNKEVAGYEPSAARYAAEMEMWQVVALEKKELKDEIERLKEIPEQLYNEMSERIAEERRIERKYTAKKMHDKVYHKLVSMCQAEDAYIPLLLTWLDELTTMISTEA